MLHTYIMDVHGVDVKRLRHRGAHRAVSREERWQDGDGSTIDGGPLTPQTGEPTKVQPMEDNTQRAIRAYLINPSTLTIEPVQMQGGKDHLADLQALIGCRTITSTPLGDHDVVYCDDEGLLGDPVFQFFGVKGNPDPIAGRGVVVGVDAEGYDTDPRMSLDEVKATTFFIERLFPRLWGMSPANHPQRTEIATLDHVQACLAGEVCHG